MKRLALAGALLLLPMAAVAHLKVGPSAVGIPTSGGAPGTNVVLCQSSVAVPHTLDTLEATLATCAIPAGLMGVNGSISINAIWSNNNSGNNKIARARFGGIGGTTYSQTTQTTNISHRFINTIIGNRNAANSQIGYATTANNLVSTGAVVTSAIDTAADTTVVLTGQLANAGVGEIITLESYTITLARGN